MNTTIKILFLLLLLQVFMQTKTKAQETWEDDSLWVAERDAIIAEIDHIFANLDKSKLTTGFLYDRIILPISGILKYDGLNDSIIDDDTWLQLHYQFTRYASFNPSQYSSTFKLDSIIRSDKNIIPIGIISLEYDKIKAEALDSGWLYIQNNQLFENPNANQSLYEKKVVFVATPLKRNIEPTVKYKIYNNFLVTNSSSNLQNIEIDFGKANACLSYFYCNLTLLSFV